MVAQQTEEGMVEEEEEDGGKTQVELGSHMWRRMEQALVWIEREGREGEGEGEGEGEEAFDDDGGVREGGVRGGGFVSEESLLGLRRRQERRVRKVRLVKMEVGSAATRPGGHAV